MPYSENIKNFERVRDYMRQFFVFGFRSRNEYTKKSARSYDNEKRRIESWLGEYMSFSKGKAGKNVFISVDSRSISSNPLYNAFKAKSFTPGDIAFHFYILDMLSGGRRLGIREIMDELSDIYLCDFPEDAALDESSVRKKLKEYVLLGLLSVSKEGRELIYSRTEYSVDLESWKDALSFFVEENPLGIIGSTLQDKLEGNPEYFSFKHHYLLHALDSEILCSLLIAIEEKRYADITLFPRRHPDRATVHSVVPFRIYVSTQTGRQYLLAYEDRFSEFAFFRIDGIHSVKTGDVCEDFERLKEECDEYRKYSWGTSASKKGKKEHLELIVRAGDNERHIIERLEREKRNGEVEQVSEGLWKYSVDCYDASELIPWLRTFIGRIEDLRCSNRSVENVFNADLQTLYEMYGGEENAVQ